MTAANPIFMILLLVLVIRWAEGEPQIYNVQHFHARGDGKTDDAKAFVKTWQAACNDGRKPTMIVPGGRAFLLSQVRFEGPCKSPITVQLDGKIVAPVHMWTPVEGSLLTFYRVDNLTVDGNGVMDGRGAIWWDCFNQKKCDTRPVLLGFSYCNNLVVRSITLTNSADKHMTLFECRQVQVNGVSITAPGDSPNTDGITMASSNYVNIANSSIQTGDDCVSILSYTSDVIITNIKCGPGHGISVGSLGGSEIAKVERITVSNCSFFETMTGVRIKSWQGGKGYARGFRFEDLNMTAVQCPIVIDQFYCPLGNCPEKAGGVAVSDVKFINIQGTSTDQQAIRILCSQSVNCRDLYLSNVNLCWLNHSAPANATVLNAHGTTAGTVVPRTLF